MPKTTTFAQDWLELIFQNTNLANLGDATGLRGDGTPGNLYIALFVTSPGEAGTGTECSYTDYARVSVARASGAGGWTVTSNAIDNTSAIQFPLAGAGSSETATAVAICSQNSGTTYLYYGSLDSNISITPGVQPEFAAGDLDITENNS